jgi:hypothetical protein
MADASEIKQAQSLVRDVIAPQNAVYLKELLHELDVQVKANATKPELEQLLLDAVNEEKLSLTKLTDWIEQTEGWGDEHVYLFDVPKTFCAKPCWKDGDSVRKHVTGVKKLAGFFDANTSFEYPEERTLTGIGFDEAAHELTCVWHQGTRFDKRVPKKDIPPRVEEDGETYFYKAYRQAARRNVARIAFRPGSALAAVFLPGVSEPKTHTEERTAMLAEVGEILEVDQKRICSMADAIKELDTRANKKGSKTLSARNTRLNTQDGGAHVEFASDTDQGYAHYASVLKVRKAVITTEFTGAGAIFHFMLSPIAGKDRDVRVNLYGDFHRIRMWKHLRREDVWAVLAAIRSALP